MKKYVGFVLLLMFVAIATVFAQSGSPAPSPAPVPPSGLMGWLSSNLALVCSLGVAVLDFLFGITPNIEANGIVHWIYLQLKALAGGAGV